MRLLVHNKTTSLQSSHSRRVYGVCRRQRCYLHACCAGAGHYPAFDKGIRQAWPGVGVRVVEHWSPVLGPNTQRQAAIVQGLVHHCMVCPVGAGHAGGTCANNLRTQATGWQAGTASGLVSCLPVGGPSVGPSQQHHSNAVCSRARLFELHTCTPPQGDIVKPQNHHMARLDWRCRSRGPYGHTCRMDFDITRTSS